jgi:tetratricopeptide (TPR) repeat protein
MIATTREAVADISDASIIALDRLTYDEALVLAHNIHEPPLSPDQLDNAITLSDGIPLFLEELIHALADPERSTRAHPVIPASLQETLAARIDRMGSEKEILHIASVIGREFSLPLLRAVAPYDADHIDSYLVQLQRQDLVYRIGPPTQARFEFKHALVQDLTYRMLLREDRLRYHRQIAQTLHQESASHTSPEVIARHLEMAGLSHEAVSYFEQAGRQAVAVSAHREAAQHFRSALDLARNAPAEDQDNALVRKLLLLLGPQLLAQSGFASEEVREVYNQAQRLSLDAADRQQLNRVFWGLWSSEIVRAELKTARHISKQFLINAISTDDLADTVAGHYMTGVSQFYSGQLHKAEIAFDRANAAYQPRLSEEMTLRFGLNISVASSSYLLWIYALTGRFHSALAGAASLLEETGTINHSVSTGFAHNFISGMYNFASTPEEAAHHARAAIALSDGQQFAQFRAQADINLGRALDMLGEADGIATLQRGLTAYLKTEAALARPYAHGWLAEAHMRRGHFKEAKENLEAALAFSEKTGERYFDAELLRLQAEMVDQFSFGKDEMIAGFFERAMEAASQSRADALMIIVAASYARFLADRKRTDEAALVATNALAEREQVAGAPLFDRACDLLESLQAKPD